MTGTVPPRSPASTTRTGTRATTPTGRTTQPITEGTDARRGGAPGASRPNGSGQSADRPTGLRAVTVSLGRRFSEGDRDVSLLIAVTLALVVYGLVMVLSSSSVEEFAAGNSISDKFVRQGLFALVGVPLMLIASRLPERFWSAMAWPLLVVGVALQALVLTPLGYEVNGNRAWIDLAGFSMQPAEVLKIALIVWLASVISRKEKLLNDWRHAFIPVVPVLVIAIGIALLTKDLGTVMVIAVCVLGALFCGGFPLTYLALGGIAAAGMSIVFAATSPNRVARISAFYTGDCDYEDLCWQSTHGLYALSAGGFFGVGLGNSRAKWSWLPEADNDFIFAIVGEEFGLVGALVMIALFVALAVLMVRLLVRSTSTFRRTIIGGVLVWLLFQGFVNIAVVLGLLPVLGVPLPLVSSGGSALLTTLGAIGIVLAMAHADTNETAARSRPRSGEGARRTSPTASRARER
ncbi:hypothetical protein GCM10011490_02070 [Pseudoclavibacter endophyticus]|uniref:Probable peptidoglycan glycosyltransferase FtsW n=1 Tax=Pseudoclavibacter endophyticus TaxID=1778590 RepID=A0A6H9WRJ6_9MICO|nr:putative lipid II flippase FtsW [Pseudoclavibacter endophyticus]KAB1650251.1 putative lipid II flippase FtsW [Pseudoclavibacter endophyticus]GGA55818.1 hypothetical protein GCM10011490_02070 [Pseudoclavibacter endophyticus]